MTAAMALRIHPLAASGNSWHVALRRRRTRRAIACRRMAARTAQGLRPTAVVPVRPPIAMSEAERRRRLERLAAYLVRTMRSCPAPGVAPFTMRDWILIGGIAAGPYLVVFAAAAIAGGSSR
jgi:hypothetical protein